MKVKDRLIKRS